MLLCLIAFTLMFNSVVWYRDSFCFVVHFVIYCFVLVNDHLFVYCGVLDAG